MTKLCQMRGKVIGSQGIGFRVPYGDISSMSAGLVLEETYLFSLMFLSFLRA